MEDKTWLTEEGRRAESWRETRQGPENSALGQEEQRPEKAERGFASLESPVLPLVPRFLQLSLDSVLPTYGETIYVRSCAQF